MERRNYLQSFGVAAGVLATGSAAASAENGHERGDHERHDHGHRVRTAADLAAMSSDELLQLSNEEVKAPFNPEIGGGRAYDADRFPGADGYPHGGTVARRDATAVVSDAADLKETVESASSGDVVWIPGDAHLDVGHMKIEVPGGVTVASDRGHGGSDGALLEQPDPQMNATFIVRTEGTRFTGFRMLAPDTEYWELEDRNVSRIYDYGQNFGIRLYDSVDTEVDNCTFRGFCYAGIRIGDYPKTASGTYVHHCEFTDTPSPSLGYGVTVKSANPMVEYNYFDNNRHAIAGSGGVIDSSYTHRNNLHGPRIRLHVIDMHGGFAFNGHDNLMKAGTTMIVENNVVLATKNYVNDYPQGGVVIRAIPQDKAVVANNWFFQPPPTFSDATSDDSEEGQSLDQSGKDGDAIVQWRTPVYKNIEAYNNITSGAMPRTVGVDGVRWDRRDRREWSGNGHQ